MTSHARKSDETQFAAMGNAQRQTCRDDGPAEQVDEAHLCASKGVRLYRSVLFQMILFGA